VTGITRSSSTATLTKNTHGYIAGDAIVVSGAAESEYNGLFTVLTADANTLTYTVTGTPDTPATGTIIIKKYDYLAIGATTFRYGDPGTAATAALGSGRVKVDFRAIQTAATIVSTKTSGTDSGMEPVRLLGTHASNTVTVLGGLVGIATTVPTEVSTFASLYVNGGTLNAGTGLTWTTLYQTAGSCNLRSGGTAINQSVGATLKVGGAGTITNATCAGTFVCDIRKATAGDTITGTLWLLDGATLDLTGNPAAIAVGTLRCSGRVVIRRNKSNPGHLTWTTLTQDIGSEISFE
jgi:hypothetical protein